MTDLQKLNVISSNFYFHHLREFHHLLFFQGKKFNVLVKMLKVVLIIFYFVNT